VPAERIAENLAFINWTLLTALAIGSLGAVILARMRTDATRGFLAFTAACAVVFGALAYLSDRALPVTLGDSPIVVNAAFDEPRRVASVRSRARMTAPSEPIASAVSSVQLMNAMFSAIRSAGTSRVYRSAPLGPPHAADGGTPRMDRLDQGGGS